MLPKQELYIHSRPEIGVCYLLTRSKAHTQVSIREVLYTPLITALYKYKYLEQSILSTSTYITKYRNQSLLYDRFQATGFAEESRSSYISAPYVCTYHVYRLVSLVTTYMYVPQLESRYLSDSLVTSMWRSRRVGPSNLDSLKPWPPQQAPSLASYTCIYIEYIYVVASINILGRVDMVQASPPLLTLIM